MPTHSTTSPGSTAGSTGHVSILRGGCNQQHGSDFHLSRPNGLPNYLLLILRGHGEFHVGEDQDYTLDPGYVIVFAPQVGYSYHNPLGGYADDWMHFMPSDRIQLSDYFPLNTPFLVDDHESCSTLVRQLLWETAYADNPHSAENVDALFQVLINHLSTAYLRRENMKKGAPYHQLLQQLRFDVGNSLENVHTISECAERLGLSESYFQYLYANQFGISFQRDLIRMRVNFAKFQLETTDLPMSTIAMLCGYTTEVHFFRQFKKIAGITPAKYRKLQYTTPKLS